MRIFSKFNDYYDHVVGHSTEPVWERHEREFILDPLKKTEFSKEQTILLNKTYAELPKPSIIFKTNRYRAKDCTDFMVLGFCGKVYPIFIVPTEGNYVQNIYPKVEIKRKTFIKPSEFTSLFNRVFRDKKVVKGSLWLRDKFPFTDDGVAAWIEKYNHQITTDIFITIKSPIFLLKYSRDEWSSVSGRSFISMIIVNPRLADYKIQSIIDPFTAYQEVDMYLGNELVGNFEPMPNFGDELKRDAHGMDNWSFKQQGPKKRKQKK
ncbi:hypothetical protein KAR91_66385 [Candidatus Pacearchaeota archaeon]|nr:hypothetical protein [Candidatus Pacearchaeota archaeon]